MIQRRDSLPRWVQRERMVSRIRSRRCVERRERVVGRRSPSRRVETRKWMVSPSAARWVSGMENGIDVVLHRLDILSVRRWGMLVSLFDDLGYIQKSHR